MLGEARQLQQGGESPRLVLNDHCQVCEFRLGCHSQAVQEDNLSLLRGIGEKEIKSLARKGILNADTTRSHVPAEAEREAARAKDRPPLPRPEGVGDPRQEDIRSRNSQDA